MKNRLVLFAVTFLFMGMTTSCTVHDDEIIETPVVFADGEIDDPVEPDREDD